MTSHLLAMLITSTLGCSPSVPDPETTPPSAEALLRQASEAVGATANVRYDYHFHAEGLLQMAPQVSGDALLVRGPDVAHARLRIHTELRPPAHITSDEAPRVMDVASDGHTVTGANHEGRVAFEGTVAEGADELITNFGGNGLLTPFVDPDPFARDLAGTELSVLGEEEIGGVPCVWVRAVLPEGARYEWALATTDHLPRAYSEWLRPGDDLTGTFLRVTNLQPNVAVADPSFRVEPPEGYPTHGLWTHLALGSQVPDLDLATHTGERVHLGDLRGQVLVLALVVSAEESVSQWLFPTLAQLHQDYADRGVRVFGVSMSEFERADPAANWVAAKANFPLLLGDETATGALKAHLPGLMYVVDPQGRVVFAESKWERITRERLDAAIAAALAP